MLLIDADATKEQIYDLMKQLVSCTNSQYPDKEALSCLAALKVINEAGPVDAEPVVRCKDCIFWFSERSRCEYHSERGADGEWEHSFYTYKDFYCSCGIRKENDPNDD